MSALTQLLGELRQSRLLPVILVLLGALVAVPVLLSKSAGASSPSSAHVSSPPGTASAATPLPAVSVQSGDTHTQLHGTGRDPFTQQAGSNGSLLSSTPPATATLKSASGVASASSASGAGKATGTGGGSSSSKGGSSVGPSVSSVGSGTPAGPPPSIPNVTRPHPPAPNGLGPNQAYNVSVALTDSSGGLNTIDSVERLSLLPSKQQPLLVELGVLKGGKRVLFAVPPGTEVRGPGKCVPGPVDCEILSLAEGQIESAGTDSGSGVTPVTDFAVTAITAKRFGSRGAANRARRKESAAGRQALRDAALASLSLFPYRPNIGAIVDTRNLKVGGS